MSFLSSASKTISRASHLRKQAWGAKRRTTARLMEAMESRMLLSTTATFVPGYSFTAGSDALSPIALVVDGSGNVYGATFVGGQSGRGTIFKVPAGQTTPVTLSAFTGTDGVGTAPSLVVDASGNVFGTTPTGGSDSNGSIFEVAALSQTPVVIHSFPLSAGFDPSPTLTIDANGNLFGTTTTGGDHSDGEIFEITAGAHTFIPVYSFTSSDGTPGGIAVDAAGDIFGVTTSGGTNGTGQLFEIAANQPAGQSVITPLQSLPGGVSEPSITLDSHGNIFGTTVTGGNGNDGTIFEYNTATQSLNTLYQFTGGSDGSFPNGRIVVDGSDDVFGTTIGSTSGSGSGAVFELVNGASNPTIIHTFSGSDGSSPTYGLVAGPTGTLYGVTSNGGANSDGTTFSVTLTTTGDTATQLGFTQQPATGVVGSLGTISVVVRDANGAVVTTDNSAVTLQIASSTTGGALGGTLTVDAVNGIATFGDITLPTAGTYTLEATDGSLTAATTASFTLTSTALPATQLAFVASPASGAAGGLGTISVAVRDANGDVVTTDNSAVTLQIASGTTGAALSGTTTVNAVNGIATFSGLSLATGGTYTLEATDGSLTAATTAAFQLTVPAPTATQLVITAQPLSGAAGTLGTISVEVHDSTGALLTSDNSTVTLQIASGPAGAKLNGTLSTTVVNGVATFSGLSIEAAGTYTLEATDGSLTAATTVPFALTVTPTTATHLVFLQQPTTTTAGHAGVKSFIVEILDKKNKLVTTDESIINIAVSGKPVGGSLSSGTTSVEAVNGVAVFSDLTFDVAGTYAITAADGALKTVKSKSLVVSADLSTAHLVLTPPVSRAVIVGAKLSGFTVTLKDQFGNLIKNNKNKVVVTASNGQANVKLGGTATAAITSGSAAFKTITVPTAGTYTVQVSDPGVLGAANVPVTFTETVVQAVTTVPAVKPSKSYAFGKTITLSTTLKSTAAAAVLFTGLATITDSSGDVLGITSVSTKGAVKATIANLAAGTYVCTLNYAGDVNHTAAHSAAFTLVVNPAKVA
jgi:uncharacterized repeat protein (TIGR03803 family)